MKVVIMALALTASSALARPTQQTLPIPGETSLYSSYAGKAAPFPGNETIPIMPSAKGKPGPDDELFQNLLSAEWIVFSLYQQAVEAFNESTFTDLGFPNTTYERILEIRDNEAGHLKIFQDAISPTSITPGPCKYDFGFTSAIEWLALQVIIEVSSMAYLTGLILQAELDASKATLVAIAETESRHNAWALIDIWNSNPFAGPADTTFPYANEILSLTHTFIVKGSCPKENPHYPSPDQRLPTLQFDGKTSKGKPGQNITFTFPDEQPKFQEAKDYYAVYYHGLYNISIPFDPKTAASKVPAQFADQGGIILAVIADKEGAPTTENVVAGPLVMLQSPTKLLGSVL